ncbi:uncharacterized protein LY89DRAFT_674608 [Mollisia scopiformis]|uniref:Uncharacterized protein n=1 Tax=Mollisia scopiformis TaxID=149040 RepID=A0A194WUD0_MOLSC|nr:uncharacterized protein LY89DRAFT_674608 [Mollisia scopiformis]KUJ11274.1 hypothetical protein LY89DRAFT_674608 [Mollisia scopiformis]
MLEALVAIGLAGNVIQFVQYAGEMISQANAIRKSGSPSSLPDLRKLTESLTKQACIIEGHLEALNASQSITNEGNAATPRSQEDQHLLDVALDCRKTGDKFLAYLDTLFDPTASRNIIRSAKLSVKFKWAQHRIDEFASKLDKFRSVLSLATILALRVKTDDHNQVILEHLQALKTDSQGRVLQGSEGTRALQALVDIIQLQSGPRLDTIQSEIEKCLKKIDDLRRKLPHTAEDDILRWLNFRQMSWRYEEVPLPYQQTFQWIFQPSRDGLWDDFNAHLTHQNTVLPYWINGKAGSGKSTLMKFVVDDCRTEEALRRWAGDKQLLVVNFFFWNLGTLLPKSNVGMLRSLIHSVLEKYPELIPAVLPELYRSWKDSGPNSDADREPSQIEIKKAFDLLTSKTSGFLKLCIFIDGIDEFEGDHKEMSMFLISLAAGGIKVVVSGRPISACINSFRDCPTLRLQDLTKPDMELYVKGNLSSHRSMVELIQRFPQHANDIVNEIKTKATGVFLWVKIVVRLLVDGLEEGDDIADLQNKLRQLPPDLRDLYIRMMGKMQPEHQAQAAEIFQLFHAWNLSIVDQPLRTLVMSLAMQPPSEALGRKVEPLETDTIQWLCQNAEARIRSRCCGLIEVHKKVRETCLNDSSATPSYNQAPKAGLHYLVSDVDTESTIEFLHRTVAEFLISGDVWNEICEMTKNSTFNAYFNFACGCLSLLKTQDVHLSPSLYTHLDNIMAICRRSTSISDRDLGQIYDSIESTMQQHQFQCYESREPFYSSLHWSADLLLVTTVPTSNQSVRSAANAFNLAARLALCQYLKAFCNFNDLPYLSRFCMVLHAMETWKISTVSLCDRSDMLLFLLENAAKPEDSGPDSRLDTNLWAVAYTICSELLEDNKHVEAAELVRIFLVKARSRRSLMATKVGEVGILYPSTLIRRIKSFEKTLGTELEELRASKGPARGLSRYFRDMVAAESAKSSAGSYISTSQNRTTPNNPDFKLPSVFSTKIDTSRRAGSPRNRRGNKFKIQHDCTSSRILHNGGPINTAFNNTAITPSSEAYVVPPICPFGDHNKSQFTYDPIHSNQMYQQFPMQQSQHHKHQYNMSFSSSQFPNSFSPFTVHQPRQTPHMTPNMSPHTTIQFSNQMQQQQQMKTPINAPTEPSSHRRKRLAPSSMGKGPPTPIYPLEQQVSDLSPQTTIQMQQQQMKAPINAPTEPSSHRRKRLVLSDMINGPPRKQRFVPTTQSR